MTRPTDSHALNSISVTACRKSRMCWEALSCRPVFLESKIHPGSCIFHRPVEFRFMFQHHRQVNYLWISKNTLSSDCSTTYQASTLAKNRAVLKRKGWLCKETRSSYPLISEGPSSEKATCIFVDPKTFLTNWIFPQRRLPKGCHCCCLCTAYRWVAKRVRYGLNLEMSATLHHRCHRVSLSVA